MVQNMFDCWNLKVKLCISSTWSSRVNFSKLQMKPVLSRFWSSHRNSTWNCVQKSFFFIITKLLGQIGSTAQYQTRGNWWHIPNTGFALQCGEMPCRVVAHANLFWVYLCCAVPCRDPGLGCDSVTAALPWCAIGTEVLIFSARLQSDPGWGT